MPNLKWYYNNMWVPVNKGAHTNNLVATIFHLAPKDQLVQQMFIASAITGWSIATSLTLSSLMKSSRTPTQSSTTLPIILYVIPIKFGQT